MFGSREVHCKGADFRSPFEAAVSIVRSFFFCCTILPLPSAPRGENILPWGVSIRMPLLSLEGFLADLEKRTFDPPNKQHYFQCFESRTDDAPLTHTT